MIPSDLPTLSLSWVGNRDRGYDVLILCGPVVVGAIVLFGRSVLTNALAAGYVLAFVVYLLWKGFGA